MNNQFTNNTNNQLINSSLSKSHTENNPANQSPPSTKNMSMNGIQNSHEVQRRRRRSRHVLIGRNFTCECGKSYLSIVALNTHIKNKHPELIEGKPKRNKGRPPKYPKKKNEDFEHSKYNDFFSKNERSPKDGNSFDILPVVQEVFSFIYKSPNADKMFSKPKSFNDIPVLLNLISKNNETTSNAHNEKTCDEVFTEYLINFMNKANREYFSFMLKFILLFRECYDLSKNKNKNENEKKTITNILSSEELPDLSNEFYSEFLGMNDFFGFNSAEKDEIVEIIQHFGIWLFKNGYTKSKISLA